MARYALVAAALAGTALAAPARRSLCPDGVNSAANPQCCSWFAIRDALISDVFENVCGENAHSTVRIAFHDAIGFSLNSDLGGGADGSIIAFPDELLYHANGGISDIVGDLQPFADAHNISYGDAIQFGASVALSLCPGAPLVQTFVGRGNASAAAPDGTVPEPFDAVDSILARMGDAGFAPSELIALLASHTIAAQDGIQPSIHGSPFDSTPAAFDPQVFLEVLLNGTAPAGGLALNQGEANSAIAGEFRLQSDDALARDPRTACTWQSFVGDQNLMAQSFATAMTKLALLGQDPNSLTDCTEVIPSAAPATEYAATFPPGTTSDDLELTCTDTPLPPLATQTGDALTVQPVPTQ